MQQSQAGVKAYTIKNKLHRAYVTQSTTLSKHLKI